jgi:hypothetical protein
MAMTCACKHVIGTSIELPFRSKNDPVAVGKRLRNNLCHRNLPS